jgi:hypothetical protein
MLPRSPRAGQLSGCRTRRSRTAAGISDHVGRHVLRTARHPRAEGAGDVDAVLGPQRAGRPYLPDAAPRLEILVEQVGKHPPVAGIPHPVQDRPAGGDVVGLVEQHGAVPGVPQVVGDDDLGSVPADSPAHLPAQRHPLLQHPIRQAEKLNIVDPDDAGGAALPRAWSRRCVAVAHADSTGHYRKPVNYQQSAFAVRSDSTG